MNVDPQIAAILSAFGLAAVVGLPSVHAAIRSRRRALRECVICARTLVLGERTCDCTDEPA